MDFHFLPIVILFSFCRMYENPLAGSDNDEDDMEVEMDTGSASATTGSGSVSGGGVGTGKGKVDRGDNFVLHFYDLAAKKPHSLYEFVKS